QQLHERITRLRLQLQNPASEVERYQPLLRELHSWLIEPIAADLRAFGARTLMLSIDDQLRLIPFAALLDAQRRYLVQDYTLALYNEAARQALQRATPTLWHIAAMGLSESVDDLPALVTVPEELRDVVHADGASGDAYLNGAFDHARFVDALAGPYNVLHV